MPLHFYAWYISTCISLRLFLEHPLSVEYRLRRRTTPWHSAGALLNCVYSNSAFHARHCTILIPDIMHFRDSSRRFLVARRPAVLGDRLSEQRYRAARAPFLGLRHCLIRICAWDISVLHFISILFRLFLGTIVPFFPLGTVAVRCAACGTNFLKYCFTNPHFFTCCCGARAWRCLPPQGSLHIVGHFVALRFPSPSSARHSY